MQPSWLADQPTYVRYSVTLTGAGQDDELEITVDPAGAGSLAVETPEGMICNYEGSTVYCFVPDAVEDATFTVTVVAEAPAYDGPSTPTEQVVTADIYKACYNEGGCLGYHQQAVYSLPVSTSAGTSYVPADTTVSLVTGPVAANPAQQVTAANPVWGMVTLPPQPEPYGARISVVTDGPPLSCLAGVYPALKPSGLVYLCRDIGFPYDAGNAKRWVQIDTDGDFGPASPMQVVLIDHPTIINNLQLGPSVLPFRPTGTPPFAVFYTAQSLTATFPKRAIASLCNTTTPVPPCLTGVTRFSNGVWRATFLKENMGGDLAADATPLDSLYALMDYVVGVAGAGSIKPPVLYK